MAVTTSLGEVLASRAHNRANDVVYTYLDSDWQRANVTYGSLYCCASRVAERLTAVAERGSRVLMLLPHSSEYPVGMMGCLYAGLVAVPAYATKRRDFVERLTGIVSNARPSVVLTTNRQLSAVQPLANEWPAKDIQWVTVDDCMGSEPASPCDVKGSSDAIAYLQYTSGSTDDPKGVMITSQNLVENLRYIDQSFKHDAESISVSWLPPFHDMGLVYGLLQPIYSGFRAVVFSPASFMQSPIRWLKAISEFRATHSGGPNFAYELCATALSSEQIDGLDLSSWRVAFCGAEPIRSETMEKFGVVFRKNGFRINSFYPAYGLAEATLKVSGGFLNEDAPIRLFDGIALEQGCALPASRQSKSVRSLVGCGMPCFNCQAVIVNPDTHDVCVEGTVGEIWVAGASVGAGYWGRAEESSEIFRARLRNGDTERFLRTGDLGFILNGSIYVTGRRKDLIIVRGRNYYPQDIELTIERCNAEGMSGRVLAFGVNVEGEERLVVVVESRHSNLPSSVESIAATMQRAVGVHHGLHVHDIVFIPFGSMPTTSSGKLARARCRESYTSGRLPSLTVKRFHEREKKTVKRNASVLEKKAFKSRWALADLVSEVLGRSLSETELYVPLMYLGVDSLMASNLAGTIAERWNVTVDWADLLQGLSIGSLTSQIRKQLKARATSGDQPRSFKPSPIPEPSNVLTSDRDCVTHEDLIALATEEERLWYLGQFASMGRQPTIAARVTLRGYIEPTRLLGAISKVVVRNKTLMTVFRDRGGTPYRVRSDSQTPSVFVDISHLPPQERKSETERIIRLVRCCTFNLQEGPLLRWVVVADGIQSYSLFLVAHHISLDAFSFLVLLKQLGEEYNADGGRQGNASTSYSEDYGKLIRHQHRWLRTPEAQRQLSYWRDELRELPQPLELNDSPSTTKRIPSMYPSDYMSFSIPPSLTSCIRAAALNNEVTVFMFILAAFSIVLRQCSQQTDLIVGVPVNGRHAAEMRDAVGCLAFPIPVRIKLSGEPTFRTILSRVREATLRASANGDIPFSRIVSAVPGKGAVLHQVLFSMLPVSKVAVPILNVRSEMFVLPTANIDCDLFMTIQAKHRSLSGTLAYRSDVKYGTAISDFAQKLSQTLVLGVHYPMTPISAFPG